MVIAASRATVRAPIYKHMRNKKGTHKEQMFPESLPVRQRATVRTSAVP